jgi:uncharacterized membrane protein
VTAASWALLAATFGACFVEAVEAATIVMAMGFTRGWRSAIAGVGTALVLLAVVASVFGYAVTTWLPESALQLLIGGLLLIFGLQWLRKAVLRAAGLKSLHDEERIFRDQEAAARAAGEPAPFDTFGYLVSLKGTFLEGMEVVFIVITFGLNAHHVAVAVYGAVAAVLSVVALAVTARRPLSMVPENTMKYVVGIMLASFGTFWVIEGLGLFRSGRASVGWPGGDASLLGLILGWVLVTRGLVALLRRPAELPPGGPAVTATAGGPRP